MGQRISIRRIHRRFWREVDRAFRVLAPRDNPCPLHRDDGFRPVFIIGSGRSGTTLIRRLLTAGGEIQIAPELHGTGPFIKDFLRAAHCPWHVLCRAAWAQLAFRPDWQDFGITRRELLATLKAIPPAERSASAILNAIHRLYASRHGDAPRWGDKTPPNTEYLGLIEKTFPDARYVHVLRDGVDVVGSLLRTGMSRSLHEAAGLWVRRVTAARELTRRRPDQCIEVRYEELVNHPDGTMKRVCDFLGLAWASSHIDRTDHVKEMGDVPRYQHHEAVERPVNRDAIGKARQGLDPETRKELGALMNETLGRFGYDPL